MIVFELQKDLQNYSRFTISNLKQEVASTNDAIVNCN